MWWFLRFYLNFPWWWWMFFRRKEENKEQATIRFEWMMLRNMSLKKWDNIFRVIRRHPNEIILKKKKVFSPKRNGIVCINCPLVQTEKTFLFTPLPQHQFGLCHNQLSKEEGVPHQQIFSWRGLLILSIVISKEAKKAIWNATYVLSLHKFCQISKVLFCSYVFCTQKGSVHKALWFQLYHLFFTSTLAPLNPKVCNSRDARGVVGNTWEIYVIQVGMMVRRDIIILTRIDVVLRPAECCYDCD